MIDRQNKGRDCRDGAWVPEERSPFPPPRRAMHRLRADYWRMTASYVETW